MEGRRRLTLLDQMSASSNGRDLAGLSLHDVLLAPAAAKQPPPPPALPAIISGRTLLDIIRDEEPKSYRALIGKKDKKAWKSFKERLLLKRAGSAWTSSVRVPTSDIPIRNTTNYGSNHHHHPRSRNSRRSLVRYVTPESDLDMTQQVERQISRRGSTRFSANPSIPPDEVDINNPRASMFSRQGSVRFAADEVAADSPRRRLSAALDEERSLSAREAVAAQEAAEAAAAALAAEEDTRNDVSSGETGAASGTAEPVRMSLMDLLEETDRQMGVESRYTMDEDEDEEVYEEEEEEEEVDVAAEEGNVEYNCCVCMVRHKGAAFIPCGHTFCRMCSRELWVQRGNCPLCNNFILEILDIF
ncbi:hypothetical protein C1H46_002096 [Malus baccata]|uniref:RING-type domain-containing protein n=1 Tax=Malus baccata TaxID=106549 RepID=A0A540NPB1_MALBA|nr:hypothetical protein C1H46_002096 [Malus baccata]